MQHDPEAIPLIGAALNLVASLIRLLASTLDRRPPAPTQPTAPTIPVPPFTTGTPAANRHTLKRPTSTPT